MGNDDWPLHPDLPRHPCGIRRERLMNKKLILSIIAGFVLGLVILWFFGFEINPF
jgi:hypothetical protein